MKSWLIDKRMLTIPFLGFYLWLVIGTAWISDDAIITFRSMENFLHGHGPVFNINERVQTFTHPLWFLTQSAVNALFRLWSRNPLGQGQMYFINIFLSIMLSLLAATVFTFKVASSTKNAILGLVVLSLSKAYLDYSTSGLEDTLSNLILVLFLSIHLERKKNDRQHIVLPAALAALGGLNRLDALLFYLPALAMLIHQGTNKSKIIASVCAGFTPLIIWELFSLFYYGAPFPNTAYAKINSEIPVFNLFEQGLFYYQNSIRLDPITLLVVFVFIIVGLSYKSAPHKSIMAGVLLYLLYIFYIGGDFMSGRFFSTPLLTATATLSTLEIKSLKSYGLSLGIAVVMGIAPMQLVQERHPSYGNNGDDWHVFLDSHMIADERNAHSDTSLSATLENNKPPLSEFARENWVYDPNIPVKVRMVASLGLSSYRMGPNVHVIDINSLADPLMARLPLYDPIHWRIGHFEHVIPQGYLETLESGRNVIVDKNVGLYYDKLALVVRGDLWDWTRMVEIWNINTGKYNHLLKKVNAVVPQE